jgi:hypothetical protein
MKKLFVALVFFRAVQAMAIDQMSTPVESRTATSDAESSLLDLKKQVEELKLQMAASVKPTEAAKDNKKISFFGDFRLRVQAETLEPNQERGRQRMQLRAGVKVEFSDVLQFVGRLMSGSSATSGNVTLGDDGSPGASRKSIGIDQAFISYQPWKFLTTHAGKIPSPFYFVGKNQIILDRDVAPEGLSVRLPIDLNDNWKLTIAGLTSQIRENYDKAGIDLTDSQLNGGQASLQWKNSDTSVLFGGGSFAFTAIKDYEPSKFVAKARDPNPDQGNTTQLDINSGASVYPSNFDNSEAFFEIKQKWENWEVSIFDERVQNTNLNSLNTAFSTGIGIGYQNFQFTVWEQKIEKDAVLALFTDSDFADGFTSSKGRIVQLSYKASQNVVWTFTNYNAETLIDTDFKMPYKRSQLDLQLSF